MTESQNKIIETLIYEFARINEAKNNAKSFNLIDTSELSELNSKIVELKILSEKDLISWRALADNEITRIAKLLREDLPEYVVIEKYGENIGKINIPYLQIRHKSVNKLSHHENLVSIGIEIKKKYISSSTSTSEPFGEALRYKVSPCCGQKSDIQYKTIEEAMKDSQFLKALRERVIR